MCTKLLLRNNEVNTRYLFTSERLGFRNWSHDDLPQFAAMNGDADVLEFFPNTLSEAESRNFITRLIDHYTKYRHNYYAVELKATGEFIGFIGLAYQVYESDFTPATDIGWRLKKSVWGNGYATEGALRCVQHAFETLGKEKLVSTCTVHNTQSENVMRKIGMKKMGTFKHSRLKEYPAYETCVWYKMSKEDYLNSVASHA